MEVFSRDEYGLLVEEVNVKNKQNFPSSQQVAFSKVRQCLECLQNGFIHKGKFMVEDAKDTILHLEVIWAFLDVFYGQESLLDRVKLALFVVHILYLGSAYVRHVDFAHYLDINWLFRECMVDCIVSYHTSVCHIILMHDYFHELPIALEKVGSDCYEDYFLLLS